MFLQSLIKDSLILKLKLDPLSCGVMKLKDYGMLYVLFAELIRDKGGC